MLFLRSFFDHETSTYTYLLADTATGEAALIDTVLEQVERDLSQVLELGLSLKYILETHVHADHVTGADALRQRTGAKVGLSKNGGAEGADLYLEHGQTIPLGRLNIEVRATPGHTDGCTTYVVRDQDRTLAFTGDALLIRGCGRTDFQQGDARTLYQSIHQQIFSLPDNTEIYPGHDYKGRPSSTVKEEKKYNARLALNIDQDRFVEIMNQLKLDPPKHLARSVPANLKLGRL